MAPVISANGEKRNWINYKTGLRHVYFKMDAGRQGALIGIHLRHADLDERSRVYERFRSLKDLLEEMIGESWTWERSAVDENGQSYARIFTELKDRNIFHRDDWPEIISFFKSRMIALDLFWSQAKDILEA